MNSCIITDRKTVNCESDYCVEWTNGVWYWIKDSKVVDSNDMLEAEEVNQLLDIISQRKATEYE